MTGLGPGSEFGGIRRIIAVLLTLLLAAIVLWDAVSSEYQVDPLVTGSILGTIASLVVVDVASLARKGRR